jgi:hypothetical protein
MSLRSRVHAQECTEKSVNLFVCRRSEGVIPNPAQFSRMGDLAWELRGASCTIQL